MHVLAYFKSVLILISRCAKDFSSLISHSNKCKQDTILTQNTQQKSRAIHTPRPNVPKKNFPVVPPLPHEDPPTKRARRPVAQHTKWPGCRAADRRSGPFRPQLNVGQRQVRLIRPFLAPLVSLKSSWALCVGFAPKWAIQWSIFMIKYLRRIIDRRWTNGLMIIFRLR